MTVLRGIEHKIESLFEGVFGRAFRSHVQPVELARKLAKEMDDHRTVSVSRVYVPNEYELYLAPRDREQFRDYEEALLRELADYLGEHARREGYSVLSAPRVRLEQDSDLAIGEFGIATRIVQPPEPAEKPPRAPSAPPTVAGTTRVYGPPREAARELPPDEIEGAARPPRPPVLEIDGRKHEINRERIVLGRSQDCDITVNDSSVSRRHAEVRLEEGVYWVVDLGSTNGTELNGKRVERAQLEYGDRIALGQSELRFDRP